MSWPDTTPDQAADDWSAEELRQAGELAGIYTAEQLLRDDSTPAAVRMAAELALRNGLIIRRAHRALPSGACTCWQGERCQNPGKHALTERRWHKDGSWQYVTEEPVRRWVLLAMSVCRSRCRMASRPTTSTATRAAPTAKRSWPAGSGRTASCPAA